jgi:DNA uptake protein ComE-like DNA-binding protein
MLASMVVVSLLFRMQAEETASVAGAATEQSWAVAMSGIYEAMRIAAQAAPGSLDWQDDATDFREHLAFDDGVERWYFTVYTQGLSDQEDVRFGLTDEASKLNLNQASEEMLTKLPKMTPYLVQGLLDFLDPDDTPRPEGAEQEYYDGLPTPYTVFNGPLATLDELLLVRGFTPALLYGEDANWNFHLDANEDDGDASFPPDNKDGKLDCGFRQYVTVTSYDLNVDHAGARRINLNDPTDAIGTNSQPAASSALTNSNHRTLLSSAPANSNTFIDSGADELPPSLVDYLQALRRNKMTVTSPAELLEAKGSFTNETGKTVELESGIGKAELPMLLDRFTTQADARIPGLININTTSATVLQTLPGMDEALADSIVSARKDLRIEQRSSPAWLYQEGLLDAGQFKKLAPYLTARSLQFHLQVVGYGVPSGRYRVLEAIIDLAGPKPVIAYLRDITRLGLPFKIDASNEDDSARPGQPPQTRLSSPALRHG